MNRRELLRASGTASIFAIAGCTGSNSPLSQNDSSDLYYPSHEQSDLEYFSGPGGFYRANIENIRSNYPDGELDQSYSPDFSELLNSGEEITNPSKYYRIRSSPEIRFWECEFRQDRVVNNFRGTRLSGAIEVDKEYNGYQIFGVGGSSMIVIFIGPDNTHIGYFQETREEVMKLGEGIDVAEAIVDSIVGEIDSPATTIPKFKEIDDFSERNLSQNIGFGGLDFYEAFTFNFLSKSEKYLQGEINAILKEDTDISNQEPRRWLLRGLVTSESELNEKLENWDDYSEIKNENIVSASAEISKEDAPF